MDCPDCSRVISIEIRNVDEMFVPPEMRPAGLFAHVRRCWECGYSKAYYAPLTFIPVYECEDAPALLFSLLKERTPEQSISHIQVPTWESHIKFIRSDPYKHWYLVYIDTTPVGSIYLSHSNEIGIFVFRAYQGMGIGPAAVQCLMQKHPGKFLANINPTNTASITMFERLGFVHIQNTYKGPTGNPYERA